MISDFFSNSLANREFYVFTKRLQELQKHFEGLQNSQWNSQSCDVDQMLVETVVEEMKKLKDQVQRLDTLNIGGNFEWIDSKIVNALRDGRYIVLEHVNLCSAAILDRLNSAFEKDGKLLISERGAVPEDDDDKNNPTLMMMMVKRAFNFQAFLTIDPRHGQLSRAMRNRCVELSLHSEAKDNYDREDKRILLYVNGVKNIDIINILIDLHGKVEQLSEYSNYSIIHLLQMATMTVNYRRLGYSHERAIYESAVEVYVSSAVIDRLGHGLNYYHERLHNIVTESVEKVKELTDTKDNSPYLADLILSCDQLDTLKMVNRQTMPLRLLLDVGLVDYQKTLSKYMKCPEIMSVNSNIEQLKDLSIYFVYLLYVMSTMNDIDLRYQVLRKVLKEHSHLKGYSKKFYESVNSYRDETEEMCRELPWNYKLFPMIRDYNDSDCRVPFFNELSIKLIVLLALNDIPQQPWQSMKCGVLNKISMLEYSQAIASDSITDIVNNDFIRVFSQFMQELSTFFKEHLHKYEVRPPKCNANHYILRLLNGLSWFNRLLKSSQQHIFRNRDCALNQRCLDKIWLHFRWLERNFLLEIFQMPAQKSALQGTNLSKLWSLLNEKGRELSQSYQEQAIRKLYVKNFTQFQAFFEKNQVSKECFNVRGVGGQYLSILIID